MKKKVFSLMMTLLLAFMGVAKAETVEIGTGSSGTTYYVPFNSLYGYSFTEQVFLASEIGAAGNITSISFNLGQSYSSEQTNQIALYMKNVSRSSFSSTSDYEAVTAGDIVYSGLWTIPANYTGWVTITLDTPFAYDGTSNLLVAMHESTSGYSTRYFTYDAVTNGSVQWYSDSYNPDPYNLGSYSGSSYTRNYRSNIQLDITAGGGGGVPATLLVHDGTATNGNVPVYGFYADAYLKCEMVYPAAELSAMNGGTINGMTFYATSPATEAWTSTWQVFVSEVADATISSFYGPGTVVYEGTLDGTGTEMTINFTTPYQYNGGNLLVGVYNIATGNYKSVTWAGESVTGAAWQGYNYSSLSAVTGSAQNFLPKTNFDYVTAGGGSTGPTQVIFAVQDEQTVDTVFVGPRPNGAWMEPFKFQIRNTGAATTINHLDWTPEEYFTLVAPELPVNIARDEDIDVELNTSESENTEWQMVALYGNERTAAIWTMVAEPYDPRTPDVWELACEEATTFPFVEVPATAHGVTLYDNYDLPFDEIPEGYDAVYKLVFDNDVMLDAEVTSGANGKVALYTEDFNGEGGPMANNNYTGPAAGGGAAAAPFEAQIGDGTSTTGYIPFYCFYNYSCSQELFLAAELEEAGVTRAPMTSLSWYCTATNGNLQSNITIWMANVEETAIGGNSVMTGGMTKVYTGNMTPTVGWDEFVFNEGTFAWDGHSNILISVQRNNGAWASGINWQCGTQSFTASGYSYNDSQGAYNMETNSYVFGTSGSSYGGTTTTRPNIIMKGGNREGGNRDVVEIGDGTGTTYYFPIDNYFNYSCTEQIYTADEIGTAGTINSISFYYNYGTAYTANNVTMYMKNVTRSNFASTADYEPLAASDVVWTGSIAPTAAGWYTFTLDTPFQYDGTSNLLVAFYDGTSGYPGTSYTWRQTTSPNSANMALRYYSDSSNPNPYDLGNYGGSKQLYTYRSNVQIDITPGAGNYSAGPVITDMPVEAGTYYLVASSTDQDFEVTINAEDMPCPDVANFEFNPSPADDEEGLDPASVTLRWMIPTYATKWRIIVGTTYHPEVGHPQTIVYPTDQNGNWTWSEDLANSYTIRNLWNNTHYFWRVEFANDGACTQGVSSPLWGFTTHLNVPQNLTAVDNTVFNDETITLNWTAVQDRTYRKYFIYRDGVKIGETQVNNINATTYTDGPLAYNMAGYTYYVTAVYDEGESAPSNTVNVKVSGYGDVNGHVYEQDGTTGIAGATVTMVGHDEFNVAHTYNFTTNNQGYYTGHIYAGEYNGQAAKDGYQTITEPVQGNPIDITYNQTTSPIDYILDENFDPVCTVIAEYYPDSLDPESPYVKVYWGCGLPGEEIIEPFETGDFSAFDWQIDPTYPWSITTNNPYEGTYCMKSGGAGVANVVSNMTVTVNIPADGIMSFFGKISSESNWDYGYFYIDGVQKGSYTGAGSWGEKKFDITAGDHTFRWQYTKDGSVNSNDDCFYVDYITFYKRPEPAQPGWHTYCESEFNNAVGSNLTPTPSWAYEYPAAFLHTNYAGWQITKVSLFSDNMYSAVGGNYTCRIYVGGNEPAAGTMVSTLTVDVPSNQNAWVDWDLTTPVNVTGNEAIWVVWTANTTVSSWPAGCCGDLNDLGTWWDGGNGWEHLTYGTWTMRHWFTNRAGRSVAVGNADNVYNAIAEANPLSSKLRTNFVKGQESNDVVCANPNAEKGAAFASEANRSLNHYRVYRTNCYNDGPYTEENTVLLATVWVPDTVYIDVEWADLEPGVYKWGVGAVYEGNRGEMVEAPINWAAPVAITRDATADNDPNPVMGEEGNRAPWDLMMTFTAAEGGHYGVAYDGNNFYTSNWGYSAATYNFYKYDLDGTMLEGFNISGCGTLRGMTYDGTYFYGVANSSTVYCVDLANHSVVSTFTSAYGAMRGITYDPQRDGFWVIGNWSGNLTLIDHTGAVQFTGPAPTSASDLAYYKDENDVEHIYCFNNADNGVYDYNITTNTMGGSVFDFSATPGYASGSSGGCTVADFNGKTAFIGDLQQSPNLIGIYELKDATVGPTPGPGGSNLNQLALPRESETIWSNCLDKDMYLTDDDVTVNVLLNSADSPEGVQVTFTNYNEAEQEMYPIDPIILDETGFYAFESFRKGEYNVKVEFEGYEPIEDSVSIWEATDLRYVMTEIIYGVSDLYVSSTGWAMWGANGIPGGQGGGGGQGGQGSTFSFDCDGGMPEGWTTLDMDGDGLTWVSSNNPGVYHNSGVNLSGTGHNASEAYVISGSYANQTGQVLYPDNYLVSPQVTIGAGSTFSFYACAQDANYPAEHFGVAVSDNGTNWTMVDEWTLTAKAAGAMSYGRDGNNRAQGNWYQKTVDLSNYAGQKYIAIRHFNCHDQFILNVDDIELTNGAKSDERHLESFKVMCTSIDGEPIYNANVPAEQPFCQLATEDLVPGDHYICKVAAIYSTGMSAWSEVEWQYIPCDNYAGTVNGVTIEGNTISWDYPGGGGGGGGQGGQGTTFNVGFEGGLPAGWTVVDANNDGYTWCLTSAIPSTWTYYASLTLDWYRTGTDAICSGSYINGVGALNPNEYLITDQVNLVNGSTFSFWAAATDATYAADHFGVFVSTTGTNPNDFTMVDEWTLTAKGGNKAGDLRASRDGNGSRLGSWHNFSVDLSAYAGQQAYIAIRHFNCNDQYIMCVDDIELTNGAKGNRAAWDLMMNFNAAEAGHYGVAYDGNNFYTSNWGYSSAAHNFYKYDLQGNMLEGFEISGCGTLRGITYDGTYFYGVANSSTVYCVDLANHSVVSTFSSSYGAMRGITYDPERDGFWVIGNWSGNLTLIDRTGAIVITGPAPESASDLAYYKDADGVEHVYCFNNGDNGVYDYNITTNTMGGQVFNFNSAPGATGSSGGCTVASFNNKIAFIGDLQQDPNLIAIYELRDDDTPAPGPTPTGDVLGAMIFADGEWEAFVEYPTNEYVYEGEAEEVCVRIVYNGTNNLPEGNIYFSMSCPECEPFTPGTITCEMPYAINSELVDENHIKVWWGEEPAAPVSEWLYYDDGTYATSVGAGGTLYWGTMFPAASLAPYAGTSLTKVAIFTSYACSATLNVYVGGAQPGGSPAATQTFTMAGDQEFMEINLNNPVPVDGTQNLWITFYQSGETYPADACADTGDANNRWVSVDGASWMDLATAGLPGYGWMIRGFVTNQAKGGVIASLPEFKGNVGGELSHTEVVSKPADLSFMNRAALVKYNVYRSTEAAGDYALIGSVNEDGSDYYEYIDSPTEAGTYYYQVRAEYDNDCESDPALAADGSGNNYVSETTTATGMDELDGNVSLYPNPTKGNVTIEANGMSRITVVSVLGQVVYDKVIGADTYTLNMSQFNAGVYMVNVYTENGVTVKRVTVMQ